MKKFFFTLLLVSCISQFLLAQHNGQPQIRKNIPLDSIRLSDPAILADKKTNMYYMTGTRGMLWKSKDLKSWEGPYKVAQPDPKSWMGENPDIWAAEIHEYNGKYYYFATFTNSKTKIGKAFGNDVERRASHVLVSDTPDGPYLPMKDKTYLPANMSTLDGTFWVDSDNKPYMIYCHEWLQNNDGTMEKIELKPDLSGSVGKGKILFKASASPWSREKIDGKVLPNRVTDGPYLFRTGTGRLGMIWTSWIYDVYTQGVAYSESGTLDGPWIQEADPITPPNFGHGMLFQTLEGKWLMAAHSHKDINGHYVRIPHLFEVDLSGDKLIVGKPYLESQDHKIPTEKDMGAYLFTYFSDPTHSLFVATSRDGYSFTAVNNGEPILAGDTIADQKGIRDPHIYRGPDGAFYLAMTDLHLFAKDKGYRETVWDRDGDKYGWGNNRGFVLMKSFDLINWTRHKVRIDESYPELGDLGCAWAPQTTYDPINKKMMLYFTMRLGNGLTKLYYAYTDDDFTKITSCPEILFEYPDPKIQILDADITHLPDGRFCMTYVAQENPGGIKLAMSDQINTGYKYQPEWIDFEPGACEAPNVWKRIGEDKWVLMYDIFSIQPHNFGFCETSDFVNFKNLGHFNEGAMKMTNAISPKHGSVIQITTEEADRLEKYWKENSVKYEYQKTYH